MTIPVTETLEALFKMAVTRFKTPPTDVAGKRQVINYGEGEGLQNGRGSKSSPFSPKKGAESV